jgi:hypothetical protein
MKAIIKESFTQEELNSGSLCVTPKSFSSVKDWTPYEVDGIKYYVDKAVLLGARGGQVKTKSRVSRNRDK